VLKTIFNYLISFFYRINTSLKDIAALPPRTYSLQPNTLNHPFNLLATSSQRFTTFIRSPPSAFAELLFPMAVLILEHLHHDKINTKGSNNFYCCLLDTVCTLQERISDERFDESDVFITFEFALDGNCLSRHNSLLRILHIKRLSRME